MTRKRTDIKDVVEKTLERLDPVKRKQVRDRVENIPESRIRAYLKATLGNGSPSNAIKAHCMECVGWNTNEIKECTCYGCALYEFRPYKDEF